MFNEEEEVELSVGETCSVPLPDFPRTAPSYFAWKVVFTGGEVQWKEEPEDSDNQDATVAKDRDEVKIKATDEGRHTLGFVPSTDGGETLGAEARDLYDPPTYEFVIR